MTAPGETSPWSDAALAAALFAVDPVGLGGIAVRAGAGPVRDAWMGLVRELLPAGTPVRRLPLHIADGRLLGGLDLAATLKSGRPVAEKGLLAEADGGVVVLAMAERVTDTTAGKLTAALDLGAVVLERDGLALRFPARFGVIALDEGIEDDERPPPALTERQAFHLDLAPIRVDDVGDISLGLDQSLAVPRAGGAPTEPNAMRPGGWPGQAGPQRGVRPQDIAAARARLAGIAASDDALEALVGTAMAFGVAGVRAPLFALRAARAHAALAGRDAIAREDIAAGARLVYAARATQVPMSDAPAEEDEPPPPPPEGEPDADPGEGTPEELKALEDVVVAAVAASIPPHLLLQLQAAAGRARQRGSGRKGAVQQGKKRGRPIGARAGEPRGGNRLNVVETLRAAAPWQRIRRRGAAPASLPGTGKVAAQRPGGVFTAGEPHPARTSGPRHPPRKAGRDGRPPKPRVEVRKDDFRVTRYKQRSETATIFVVDASGSTALHRLSEAKGAVELLLADCYIRRDQVALVAFRGKGADLLLPPTRSLFRAKRCLEALPGGGGTPLAHGLDAAAGLADALRRKGQTPTVVLVTDGRANIARDGAPGRPKAEADALAAARALRAARVTALVVDNAPRPEPRAQRLADAMGALYMALPQADAAAISKAVQAVLPAG